MHKKSACAGQGFPSSLYPQDPDSLWQGQTVHGWGTNSGAWVQMTLDKWLHLTALRYKICLMMVVRIKGLMCKKKALKTVSAHSKYYGSICYYGQISKTVHCYPMVPKQQFIAMIPKYLFCWPSPSCPSSARPLRVCSFQPCTYSNVRRPGRQQQGRWQTETLISKARVSIQITRRLKYTVHFSFNKGFSHADFITMLTSSPFLY